MYVSGIERKVEWVDKLLRDHAPKGWKGFLYVPKRGKPRTGVYGHADLNEKRIEICVSDVTSSQENIWAVLHEIAHAIHESSPTYVLPQRVKGRYPRGSLHPPEFWDIAIVLYMWFGMMEFASTREYIIGQKRIKAHLAYAARMRSATQLAADTGRGD